MLQIHSLCSKLPPVDAQSALRFLASRLDCKAKEVATAWKQDRAARAEAEMRKRDQLRRALKGMSATDVAAVLNGTEAGAKQAKPKAEVN